MKLLFKQRFFSWFDSYDIYYEDGTVAYTVEGQLSWGHKLHINDSRGAHIATVKEKVFTFLPCFELYTNGNYLGSVRKKFTFLRQAYVFDFNGWQVSGNFMGWDYDITDGAGSVVARVSKQIFHFTDTYVIETPNPSDALCALMFTLSIDAEKCARGDFI